MAGCRSTFRAQTLNVGFRPLPQTTRIGNRAMFKHHTDTLKIGDPAPDFSLPSVDGRTYSRNDLLGAVSMIGFFRGTW